MAGSVVDTEPLWTVEDAAAYLRVTTRTVHRWRTEGLPHRRVGTRIRFVPAEVRQWATAQAS